jgi:hypothetical protein
MGFLYFYFLYMWRSGVTDPSIPGFRTGTKVVVGLIQYGFHRNMGGSHSRFGSRRKKRNLFQCQETNSSPLIVHNEV